MKKEKVLKILLIIIILILTTGFIVGGIIVYNKINKKGVETKQLLTQEQAIEKAKEISQKLGKNFGNSKGATFSDYTSSGEIWSISTDTNLSIDIHADTGKLSSVFDFSIDDTKIPSTTNKQQAEKLLKQTYLDLGYKEGEYELKSAEKNKISDDTNIWNADFCKKYDGIYNKGECIRIGIIPEKKHLKTLVIFDYKFENNEVIIEKEKATEIAQNKEKENSKDKVVEKIETKLDIEITKNKTTRKVWEVAITYKNNMYTDRTTYFIDATTGEIVGDNIYL